METTFEFCYYSHRCSSCMSSVVTLLFIIVMFAVRFDVGHISIEKGFIGLIGLYTTIPPSPTHRVVANEPKSPA